MVLTRKLAAYEALGTRYESMLIEEEAAGEQPGLLLFPNFLGTKEADFAEGERLASLGFKVLVVDFYGAGKRGTDMASGGALMEELVTDRALMREKLLAHLEKLRGMAEVIPGKIAAVGYCLGGKCVLDLARAGIDLVGAIVHGVYDPPAFANAAMAAKLLVCHGWNDPLGPPEALIGLGDELTAGGADWSLLAFGGAGHAFTDGTIPLDETSSFGFEPNAAAASWDATALLLTAAFQ